MTLSDALMAEIHAVAALLQGEPVTVPSGPVADFVTAAFSLSGFERQILLLAAGVELSGEIRRQVPELTFSLALEKLPDAHWSAITPVGPLRKWHLIEVDQSASLCGGRIRIAEPVLHFLAGSPVLDPRLAEVLSPVAPEPSTASQQGAVERILTAWREPDPLPVRITGTDEAGRRAVFTEAAETAGLRPFVLPAESIPASAADRETLARLLERDASLLGLAIFLEARDTAALPGIERLCDRISVPLVLAGEAIHARLSRRTLGAEVRKPEMDEQRLVWRDALGEYAESLNGQVDRLASQFDLGVSEIRRAAAEAHDIDGLWKACLSQARPGLETLADRVVSSSGWDDLVLPDRSMNLLKQIAGQVRHRHVVMERWGMKGRSGRGSGVAALFAGPSGTGKTLAAEVIANELGLDLFRIDLSQVVNKYIGETEKNLGRVFDAAEAGGAVLLFDEADALFGKRSEVKDSHDRYANLEVGYLLQRIEAYQGLAILTTNLKDSLDHAFLRRLRFVVNFPFPDHAQRTNIWDRAFPSETPVEGLRPEKLAQLSITGGAIRSIALNAAFIAADRSEPVRHTHIHRAALDEYAKHDRPLSSGETEGWT